MEHEAFRSLNGIEISSLLLDRQRQSQVERAAGRRRLILVAKVVPLYDDLYSIYERQGARRRMKASDKALTDIVQEPAGSPRFNLEDD